MISQTAIRQTVERHLPEARQLLVDLVRIPSTSGNERDAMLLLHDRLGRMDVAVEKAFLSDALLKDPDYSDPVPDLRYDGRFNLRVVRRGAGGGRTLLFNTHLDVVPPSEGMTDAWTGRVDERDIVYGRGACDAKGQAATFLLVLRTLEALGAKLRGEVIGHLVVEEENGGNGTLALTRRGAAADGVVVMEPSDGRLYTSVRGAVWFRLAFRGKAGHSGQAGQTRSALLMARDAIAILEKYHADLLRSSRGFPLFDAHPNPMPITFGRLQAGNWPASAPSQAVLEGVLGFLPNRTHAQVCEEMRRILAGQGDEFLAKNFDLHFMYRHDCSVVDPGHELPQALCRAATAAGSPLEVGGMTASCDAWFYTNQLNIPGVVYGPGSLKVAHSKDEQIAMPEIARAAEVLVRLILDYCGVEA